jgi:hypothetical protein
MHTGALGDRGSAVAMPVVFSLDRSKGVERDKGRVSMSDRQPCRVAGPRAASVPARHTRPQKITPTSSNSLTNSFRTVLLFPFSPSHHTACPSCLLPFRSLTKLPYSGIQLITLGDSLSLPHDRLLPSRWLQLRDVDRPVKVDELQSRLCLWSAFPSMSLRPESYRPQEIDCRVVPE